MKKLLILLVGVLTFASSNVLAQGLKDVKINEILVKNQTSYTDDHSEHSSWIELYNSGYTSANLAGTSLRFIQGKDTVVYRIPKTDARTIMPPQGYVIFYASGASNKGTFHTNFSLDQLDSTKLAMLVGIDDKLELLDQSGRAVIDSIVYDVNTQIPDVSYGRVFNYDDGTSSVTTLQSVTPMQSNEITERIPKSELFRMEDPAGLAMSVIAMTVVFVALIALYLIFKILGTQMHKHASAKMAATKTTAQNVVAKPVQTGELNGEEVAAVSLALFQYYRDVHDMESEIITINRVARIYSPWSSKIYTLTSNPRKK